jgi:magnesium and cobalt transporter
LKRKGIFQKLFVKSSEDEESFHSLNVEEKDMIRGVVQLSQKTVKDVIVPRIDVIAVDITTSIKEVTNTLNECGHSRVPVYQETIDNVVGILYAKDLLRWIQSDTERSLEDLIRKPYFVPESMRLDALLKEFKRRKVHIAVAVDEYGGVSGIICLEDIIEEILGDIQDEFDNESEEILKIGKNTFLIDARTDIEELNERFSLELPVEDIDTLGGFVFELFRKIPVKYEKVSYEGTDFIIQEMQGHKIRTVKVVLGEESE